MTLYPEKNAKGRDMFGRNTCVLHVCEQDFEVRLESVQICQKKGLRQGLRSKQTIPTVSRILSSGGTLDLGLRENLTKKYLSDVMTLIQSRR